MEMGDEDEADCADFAEVRARFAQRYLLRLSEDTTQSPKERQFLMRKKKEAGRKMGIGVGAACHVTFGGGIHLEEKWRSG